MRLSLAYIFLMISIYVNAQTCDSMSIYANAHGLIQQNRQYFEVEGYSIISYDYDNLYFDKGGIRLAKRKCDIENKNKGAVDSSLRFPNKYFVTELAINGGLTQRTIIYFTPTTNNKLRLIAFSTMVDREIEVEQLFFNSIAGNTVPAQILTQPEIDSVNFAGRYLFLGPVCQWMDPHNIQCPDYGQINWSESRSMQRAKDLIKAQYTVTSGRNMGDILSRDSVDVIFEGNEIKVLKIKYKIKVPRLIMGGSNTLIIYFVVAEVRQKYIACVMSQFTDDVNGSKLAPLLNELMQLKN